MQQRIEGQTCSQCGKGTNVKSPKTGKVFCDQKCWLGPNSNQNVGYTPNYPNNAQNSSEDVIGQRVKEKRDNINWLNARKSACDAWIAGKIDLKDLKRYTATIAECQPEKLMSADDVAQATGGKVVEDDINVGDMPLF